MPRLFRHHVLPSTQQYGSGQAAVDLYLEGPEAPDSRAPAFCTPEFRMYLYKVKVCPIKSNHDWVICPYAHNGERAVRRDPCVVAYSGEDCPDYQFIKRTAHASCPRGKSCPFSHGVFEKWLHPTKYQTKFCKEGPACRRRVCFFAHFTHELRIHRDVSDSAAQPVGMQPSWYWPEQTSCSQAAMSASLDANQSQASLMLLRGLGPPSSCAAAPFAMPSLAEAPTPWGGYMAETIPANGVDYVNHSHARVHSGYEWDSAWPQAGASINQLAFLEHPQWQTSSANSSSETLGSWGQESLEGMSHAVQRETSSSPFPGSSQLQSMQSSLASSLEMSHLTGSSEMSHLTSSAEMNHLARSPEMMSHEKLMQQLAAQEAYADLDANFAHMKASSPGISHEKLTQQLTAQDGHADFNLSIDHLQGSDPEIGHEKLLQQLAARGGHHDPDAEMTFMKPAQNGCGQHKAGIASVQPMQDAYGDLTSHVGPMEASSPEISHEKLMQQLAARAGNKGLNAQRPPMTSRGSHENHPFDIVSMKPVRNESFTDPLNLYGNCSPKSASPMPSQHADGGGSARTGPTEAARDDYANFNGKLGTWKPVHQLYGQWNGDVARMYPMQLAPSLQRLSLAYA